MSSPGNEPLIDAALGRVRRGEVAAFEPIVRRYERPLRAWLAAHAPPGVDVDEIAQRSFIAAYTHLAEFAIGTNFSAWLYTIARFQLRTETTRLRRVADYYARYAPDLLQRELERRAVEPPEKWETRLHYLRECLGQLAEPLRQLVRWRYEDGIPLEQMAKQSGRSVAAIKKQLWCVRRQLQECVEGRIAAERA